MNKKELTRLLNKALADEWLSYYRYWIGAKVMVGDMKETISKELEEMATYELKHAGILVDQIIKLDGTPLLKPADWYKKSVCGYEPPKDCTIKSILFQNIKNEQCSIEAYKKLVNFTKSKNYIDSEILVHILDEEIQQKDDLINIMEHLEGKSSQLKI